MNTAIALTVVLLAMQAPGQVASDEAAVRDADGRFWQAYNSCNVEAMSGFFTEDLEFYHDRGGLTQGKAALVEQTREGLCKPGGTRLRREAVAGTVRFDPVPGHGAILTGEHVFYVREPGQAERADGQAQFAHVWQHADGKWRMRRVLSYHHAPPRVISAAPAVTVPAAVLVRHAGRYESPTQGIAEIAERDGRLQLSAGALTLMLEPISEASFSAVGRNLRFDFAGDSVSIWENGSKVDEARRID